MDIKYTFFISSTYSDLVSERRAVANYIAKIDEIPIGMEQFGAVDTSQWAYIERLIKTSDYFVLILAGRYGSIDETDNEGLSYTHKEFRLAVKNNIPTICLLRTDLKNMTVDHIDINQEMAKKLEDFKIEVKRGRLVDFFSSESDLIGNMAAAISKAKTLFKRPGWVRNDMSYDIRSLQQQILSQNSEINTLRELLRSRNSSNIHDGLNDKIDARASKGARKAIEIEYLFSQFETIMIDYTDYRRHGSFGVEVTYSKLFAIIARRLRDGTYERSASPKEFENLIAQDILASSAPSFQHDFGSTSIKGDIIKSAILKFVSLELIGLVDGRYYVTPFGIEEFVKFR